MIAVPSWVIPGGYADNLTFLADKAAIEAVELLFYMYNDEVAAQLDADWTIIESYAKRFHFSAHLPDLLEDCHEDLVARLSPLVESFVVHPHFEEAELFRRRLLRWRDRYGDRFYLENTLPGRLESIIAKLPDWPVCLDTGHCLLEAADPSDRALAIGKHLKEIHLHDLNPSAAASDQGLRDHRALNQDSAWLVDFKLFLQTFPGLVVLEQFSWADIEQSLKVLGITT